MTPVWTWILPETDNEEYQPAALFRDDRLFSYYRWKRKVSLSAGDIVLGRVSRMMPSLSAAFVDIGTDKNGFLPLEEEELKKFRSGQEVVVEIKKEATENKGMALTCHFSLHGDHVVLSYGNTRMGVSKKISDMAERDRLKTILRSFPRLDGVGYIVRTEGEGMSADSLKEEASSLASDYLRIMNQVKYSTIGTVLSDTRSEVLKALLNVSAGRMDKVIIEDPKTFYELFKALNQANPEKGVKVCQASEGTVPISAVYRLESQLKEALESRVFLNGSRIDGGYLFVEETHACSTIDVNTGMEIRGTDREQSITEFNCLSCAEIAHQIILRNLSGVILIDFINMDSDEDREKTALTLKQAFSDDVRQNNFYGFTSTGLFEMTRARREVSLKELMKL